MFTTLASRNLRRRSGPAGGLSLGPDGSNVVAVPITPGGRLSLATATPVMTSTQSAKTTIYYTPYAHRFVPIYDGTRFVQSDIGGELSQATTDTTKSPAAVTTNSNYDLFVWNDAGTYRCTRGPAWSSATSRGTGPNTTELTQLLGVYVNANAITNGPAANRGTYVGTVRSNGSSQIDWTLGSLAAGWGMGTLGVWNMYNRGPVATLTQDSTDNWTYSTTGTWRASNGNSTARINYVCGLSEDAVSALFGMVYSTNSLGNAAAIGIGIDSTTAFSGTTGFVNQTTAIFSCATYCGPMGLGFHYVSALEYVNVGTGTFNGDSGAPTWFQSGLSVQLRM